MRSPKLWPIIVAIAAAVTLNAALFLLNPVLLFAGLCGIFLLSYAATARLAFYSGLVAGFLVAAIQLKFFFFLFSYASITLWLVLSFWVALFCVVAWQFRRSFKPLTAAFLCA